MNSSVRTTITATETRKQLFNILDQIKTLKKSVEITLNGKPCAVIIPHEEYEALTETDTILKDKKLMKEIDSADKDYKKGEYIELEKLLQEEGFILNDSAKLKYNAQSNRKKKGSKKPTKNSHTT